MKHSLLCAAFVLLTSCATVKDNLVLQQMQEQDQNDRRRNDASVGIHDAAHQRQVRRLLATKRVRTGNDCLNAAVILQHADSASDFLQAHELAKKAVRRLPQSKEAKTLVAQSWDRYQRRLGKPQWYGTQRVERDGREYLQLLDSTKVTEDSRRAYFVSTLAEKLAYFNTRTGTHANSIFAYVLTNEQQRQLERQASGMELIGSYADLFRGVTYPVAASQAQVTGFVVVEATVEPAGTVSRAEVVKGLGYGCDEEATRLIRSAKYRNPTGEAQEIRVKVPFGPPTP